MYVVRVKNYAKICDLFGIRVSLMKLNGDRGDKNALLIGVIEDSLSNIFQKT